VINDDLDQPPFEGYGHYDVTGLDSDKSYCFEMRSVALETNLGGSYTANSDWSAPRCAHTPAQPAVTPPAPTPTPMCSSGTCFIGPLPNIDLSWLGALAPLVSVIRSPQPDQVTHDVLVNVVRAKQDKDDGVFDLQWSYLQGGAWQTPDSGPLNQLDKSSFPNGVNLPNAAFKSFPCGSDAAPCAFRTWRVRARLHGVTTAPFPSGAPWSDWVQFRVN
jgi:hypothetical protein